MDRETKMSLIEAFNRHMLNSSQEFIVLDGEYNANNCKLSNRAQPLTKLVSDLTREGFAYKHIMSLLEEAYDRKLIRFVSTERLQRDTILESTWIQLCFTWVEREAA